MPAEDVNDKLQTTNLRQMTNTKSKTTKSGIYFSNSLFEIRVSEFVCYLVLGI